MLDRKLEYNKQRIDRNSFDFCPPTINAQDLIQDQGVFYSRSEDASGLGRNQIVDSNWIVIEQNLKPGEPFTEGDALLSVIKVEEAENQGLC
jgi:hypothetical protein